VSVRRWFLDTEFYEDGRIIDLISIALVSEDGQFYYAVSEEFDAEKCNEWVRENVLPKLPPPPLWMSRARIARDIRAILLAEDAKPEIWGYFCDYDWVALCQLYGPMISLPKGFPFWCCDLKQLMAEHGVEKKDLPPEDTAEEHNALADARWIRGAYLHLARRLPAQPGTEGRLLLGIQTQLREIRGELAGIRTRLDSLVGVEQQLRYQGQRLSLIEKRLAALVETRVTPLPVPATTFQSPPGPAG
jgi:3'-5' exoribonuclease-like protein